MFIRSEDHTIFTSLPASDSLGLYLTSFDPPPQKPAARYRFVIEVVDDNRLNITIDPKQQHQLIGLVKEYGYIKAGAIPSEYYLEVDQRFDAIEIAQYLAENL